MSLLASHPYLLAGGTVLLVLGAVLWRWSSRHDLQGLAVEAAWHVARNRGRLGSAADTEIAGRLKEVVDAPTHTGRARRAAGVAARHVLARVAGIASIVAMLGGVMLVVAAVYLGR